MTDEPELDDRADRGEQASESSPLALPRWKKGLLIGATVLVAIGLALLPFQSGREELAMTQQGAGQGETLQGPGGQLVPGNPGEAAGGAEETAQGAAQANLSPAFLKMGFSFLAAFAVGLAFRSFLKLALIFVGLQLIALFGLSYVEWVTVNWQTMASAFDHFAANVKEEAASFQTFVTGSLPQAGLATLGLVAGFKK